MPQCSFCKNQYEFPRGTTFVLINGEVLYFCSSKCHKNSKLGRKGEKTNWVKKRQPGQEKTVKEVGKEDQSNNSAKKEKKISKK